MRDSVKRGSTSVLVPMWIPDNSSAVGAGLSGLTNSSTNLTIAYRRELDSAYTVYAQASSNIEAQTTIGTFQAPSTSAKIRFKEEDATNNKGAYELQFHNSATAFGTGDASKYVEIVIFEVTTTALHIGPCRLKIALTPYDPQDGNLGLTGLTGLTAPTAGALPTSGVGTNQIKLATGLVAHDMTQAVPTTNTAQTVGDAYNAMRAQGFGKWRMIGTSLILYAADGDGTAGSTGTVVRTLTLDSATAPTERY